MQVSILVIQYYGNENIDEIKIFLSIEIHKKEKKWPNLF